VRGDPDEGLVQIFHGLDEVRLAQDDVDIFGLVDSNDEQLHRDLRGSCGVPASTEARPARPAYPQAAQRAVLERFGQA
jgi:hypothetical protein